MWWMLASMAFGQAVDFECTPQTSAGLVVGTPPFMVDCTADVSDLYSYSEAEWLLGDGTVLTGDRISHTYTEVGQFDVHLYLSDFDFAVADSADTAGPPIDGEMVKRGLVTSCGMPEVQFTYVFKGGLDYELHNESDFVAGCVDSIQWMVYRGEGRSGAPILESSVWDARFELPEDGVYTFVLELGGIGGAGAAKLTVDAKYGLTEEIGTNRSSACSSAGIGGAWLAWLGLLAAVGRRRR